MYYVSGVKIAMIMGMRSSIASQCDFIRNCTPERREKNTMELLDHFDRVAPGIIDEYAGMTESEIDMERRIHR